MIEVSYPKIIPTIDIPLDEIAIALWGKRIETVALADFASLFVRLFFMLLVVTMVCV